MSFKTSGFCPWGCGAAIEISIGEEMACPSCGEQVRGTPDEGIPTDLGQLRRYLVGELAHLLELERGGQDISSRRDWLSELLPEEVISQVLLEARSLLEAEGGGR